MVSLTVQSYMVWLLHHILIRFVPYSTAYIILHHILMKFVCCSTALYGMFITPYPYKVCLMQSSLIWHVCYLHHILMFVSCCIFLYGMSVSAPFHAFENHFVHLRQFSHVTVEYLLSCRMVAGADSFYWMNMHATFWIQNSSHNMGLPKRFIPIANTLCMLELSHIEFDHSYCISVWRSVRLYAPEWPSW